MTKPEQNTSIVCFDVRGCYLAEQRGLPACEQHRMHRATCGISHMRSQDRSRALEVCRQQGKPILTEIDHVRE